MTRLRSTVFLRPMRFISIPVGTEKMRNQKNTRDGNMLACESVQVGLHVVGGDAHQIHKAHGEEAKHDRKELCQGRILSIFHAEDYYLLF